MIVFQKEDLSFDSRLVGQALPNGSTPVALLFMGESGIQATIFNKFVTIEAIMEDLGKEFWKDMEFSNFLPNDYEIDTVEVSQ
jgi:hypothetical protein